MKKTLMAILLTLLIISGCTSKVEDYNLTSVEVIEMMDNKDSFLLYFTSKTCPACIAFEPVYQDVRKDNKEYMYALDIGDESNDNPEDLTRLLTDYTGNVNVTPTILVIVDGKVEQGFLGALKYSELENALINYKIID